MGTRWTVEGRDGWDIELIVLDERPVWRVRQHRMLVGDARTPGELERLLARHGIGLADLTEIETDEP